MSIPIVQLGWMAGIIDLRGKVVAKDHKTRRTKQITLYVESSQFPVIRRLSLMTGTSPEHKTAGPREGGWWRRGCDEHCPDQHVHVARSDFPDTMRWTISGVSLGVVLHNLMPYMVQEKGLEQSMQTVFTDMTLRGRGAKAVVDSLRRLEALGWDFPENVKIPDSLSSFDVEPEPEETEDDLPGL